MMNKIITLLFFSFYMGMVQVTVQARNLVPVKPRILISTDIGGTDPDDNQSMAHLLMFGEQFEIEGLVSSPSFGPGSKREILRMIDLYEKDLLKLQQHISNYPTPDYLRRITKEGRKSLHPYRGYAQATEGSDWIVKCARKESDQPLWVLVWGGLEDLAQALHDAPDIQHRIRVYWIGGPNKKWSVNSYAYIADHFPDLWLIENNSSYRGITTNPKLSGKYNKGYYDSYIRGAGELGKDFIKYYDGIVKMGDTPSLLYMMDGDPNDPSKESWGGSFERIRQSPRTIFTRTTTVRDTVPVYSVVEFQWKGPIVDKTSDTPCFTFHIDKQDWDGYYLGEGIYGVRYAPKSPATLKYTVSSEIQALNGKTGTIVVDEMWPGKASKDNYKLGNQWFTDKTDSHFFSGIWQGYKTVEKWRIDVLTEWAERWGWLK